MVKALDLEHKPDFKETQLKRSRANRQGNGRAGNVSKSPTTDAKDELQFQIPGPSPPSHEDLAEAKRSPLMLLCLSLKADPVGKRAALKETRLIDITYPH